MATSQIIDISKLDPAIQNSLLGLNNDHARAQILST